MSDRISTLREYLKDDPNDPFLRYALALEIRAAGQNETAFEELMWLIENQPDYLPSYYMAGQVAEQINKIPEAVLFYQKGIELAKAQNQRNTLGELKTALSLIWDEDEVE
ncbi:MAG: tetratricopeptide repeat protein [Bacteroidetes bacterium]|nr:tetratricopeptide repeat protein [Bacteroidota bacterium]